MIALYRLATNFNGDTKQSSLLMLNEETFEPQLNFNRLRLGAQSSYVVKYFEGSNAVKTTSMRN